MTSTRIHRNNNPHTPHLHVRPLAWLRRATLAALAASSLASRSRAAEPTGFVIDLASRRQTIRNFAASDAWNCELVGKTWPEPAKRGVARLLFSSEADPAGTPLGIGLSAWRFNIGGGSAEQGDQSGIGYPGQAQNTKRVECFLNPDGSYDWSKQAGQRWFLHAAQDYGVKQFIAFCNSPPVCYTKNGLARSTAGTSANLKPECYDKFAGFLAEVMIHFRDREGINFTCLSPVNEPQWKWDTPKQEGTPFTNAEIRKLLVPLNREFVKRGLTTKLQVPECADMRYGYGHHDSPAGNQIHALFDATSPDCIGTLPAVARDWACHGYWVDGSAAEVMESRRALHRELERRGLAYVMSEYCLLGPGPGTALPARPLRAIDSALLLARIIHADLTEGEAVCWQFWTALDSHRDLGTDLRYLLVERNLRDGTYHATKLLWALGHYSRFIRPGFTRVAVRRSDGLSATAAAEREMVSAYLSQDLSHLVVVAINWQKTPATIRLSVAAAAGREPKPAAGFHTYLTTAAEDSNMKHMGANPADTLVLPPQSITTCTIPIHP